MISRVSVLFTIFGVGDLDLSNIDQLDKLKLLPLPEDRSRAGFRNVELH
jgi:hypothetical protein